jgi:small-conductance mechanosensitive channel
MKENEKEKNEDIIMYTTIIILFFIIYIIYLSIIIKYITNNYHRKKLCVFWIDYCILTFAAIIFMIIYVINLIANGTGRIDSITCLKKRIFPITIIISLAMLVYTIINSLIFDTITAFQLSFKMNKIKKIEEKEDDFFALAEKFKNINNSK